VSFEYFDHTADVGIRVQAEDLRTVFLDAARGMLSIIAPLPSILSRRRIPIRVFADNTEELLFVFLKEILFISEKESMLFSDIQIQKANFSPIGQLNCFIVGSLAGETINLSRHDICTEIKAVTHHGFFFRKEGPVWGVQIVFDV